MSLTAFVGASRPPVPRLPRISLGQPHTPVPRQSVRVLIVEPDQLRAASIQRALLQQGFEVTAVLATLGETSPALQQPGPDLVVIDVFGHDNEAGRIAAKLVKQTWQVPVIYPATLPRHLNLHLA